MTGELLAVVHAEERAAALVKEAGKRRDRSIEQAHHEREKQFAGLKPIHPRPVHVDKPSVDAAKLKGLAKKNKKKAVDRVLEAIYAT